MHHGDESQQSDTKPTVGATGRFPQGKLNANDEGELAMAITHKDGKVIIDFGKPTAWIGFDPQQAIQLASLLKMHASSIEIEKTVKPSDANVF